MSCVAHWLYHQWLVSKMNFLNSLTLLQQMSIVAGVAVFLVVSITVAAVWVAHRQNNKG